MAFTIVDYVWIGGNSELRSKSRVLYQANITLQDIPSWNYDGSSTNQADGESSEVFIFPKRLFKCPFRKGYGYIVMCDTYTPKMIPHETNTRSYAQSVFDKYANEESWYGLEQEYFMYNAATNLPLGFNQSETQGQFYCSVGSKNSFGRAISDEHMDACLYAGIKLSGTNAEVAPGQWEFQVGPVEGIDASDQLWIARYLLEKISEKYGIYIVYDPKPLSGDWNGSGCHTNFSTKSMREDGGYEVILGAMVKLSNKHKEHMKVYGENNDKRMSGLHETSKYDVFSFGVANRKVSVRIPSETAENKKGYFEDRRPASNMDPYIVTAKILETIMG